MISTGGSSRRERSSRMITATMSPIATPPAALATNRRLASISENAVPPIAATAIR